MNDKVELLKKECELEKLPFFFFFYEYTDFYQILNDIINKKESPGISIRLSFSLRDTALYY